MNAKDGKHLLGLVALIGLMTCQGCRKDATYPKFAESTIEFRPGEGATSGFEALAAAGAAVEKTLQPELLRRVSFTPGERKKMITLVSSSADRVGRAAGSIGDFPFRGYPPDRLPPFHAGWRAISRVWAWKIEDAVAAGNFGAAVTTYRYAGRFAWDLMRGGAQDGLLGILIVSEARAAIAKSMASLPVGALQELADVAQNLDESYPDIAGTLQRETLSSKQALQLLQDLYQAKKWTEIESLLGSAARDAVEYLHRLKPESQERKDYFESLAKEIDEEALMQIDQAKRPVSSQRKFEDPSNSGRPWRIFRKTMFQTGRLLVLAMDETRARNRLLALHARALAASKSTGKTLAQLDLKNQLILDPYSGRPFIYRTDGTTFELYSVGVDGVDDGGRTDSSGRAPDLRLEGFDL